jgi:hypothetical protein
MAQADRYARIGEVMRGVLPVLDEMLNRRGINVDVSLPESLPDVFIGQNLLRQMLLGMLGYLIQ